MKPVFAITERATVGGINAGIGASVDRVAALSIRFEPLALARAGYHHPVASSMNPCSQAVIPFPVETKP